MILRFNTQSHERPSLAEYSDAVPALEHNTQPAVGRTAVQMTPNGINTTGMDDLTARRICNDSLYRHHVRVLIVDGYRTRRRRRWRCAGGPGAPRDRRR